MQTETDTSSPLAGRRPGDANGHAATDELATALAEQIGERLDLSVPLPGWLPPVRLLLASGLYEWSWRQPLDTTPHPRVPHIPQPQPIPTPGPGPEPGLAPGATAPDQASAFSLPIPIFLRSEELRLDVDGRYPQMVVSGTSFYGYTEVVHWIANVAVAGPSHWTGTIWYKNPPSASFAYTTIDVRLTRSVIASGQYATVTLSGGGPPARSLIYRYVSPYFHPIEFEFDSTAGAAAVTSINTGDHPNRPPTLPIETLTLERVYQRAGFNVTASGGNNTVPLALAGANKQWSNQELHDAMQVYWSRFAPKAQWSVWTFFTARHELGTGLGGIMFDYVGSQQRQGTAIFEDSFISDAPAGDANPAAWVRRNRFWTAAHEMGHTFNLAHSWEKSFGTGWIPLTDEPGAFSFMNYPYRIPPGPQDVFYRNFEFRFSDSELLFMRHAPSRFVEQGNADWADDHGFSGANVAPSSAYRLELRVNRSRPEFEFLEPVVVELKLSNVSDEPQLIPENLLAIQDRLTVIIKKDGRPARRHLPYARFCFRERKSVLDVGADLYDSLFISAGRNGWDLAEPGFYTLQVALHLDDQDVVSNPLRVRVAPPRGYDEEYLAQDFFSDHVGRILTFDGSSVLDAGNEVLRQVTERLPDRRVAIHARVALGNAVARDRKRLEIGGGHGPAVPVWMAGGRIVEAPANPGEARRALGAALTEDPNLSAETLGHIDYHAYVDTFAQFLADQGEAEAAAGAMTTLHETLSQRNVRPDVLAAIQERRDTYRRRRKHE